MRTVYFKGDIVEFLIARLEPGIYGIEVGERFYVVSQNNHSPAQEPTRMVQIDLGQYVSSLGYDFFHVQCMMLYKRPLKNWLKLLLYKIT